MHPTIARTIGRGNRQRGRFAIFSDTTTLVRGFFNK
jgi:hypothetical protein